MSRDHGPLLPVGRRAHRGGRCPHVHRHGLRPRAVLRRAHRWGRPTLLGPLGGAPRQRPASDGLRWQCRRVQQVACNRHPVSSSAMTYCLEPTSMFNGHILVPAGDAVVAYWGCISPPRAAVRSQPLWSWRSQFEIRSPMGKANRRQHWSPRSSWHRLRQYNACRATL
jgi:hypothetical protein